MDSLSLNTKFLSNEFDDYKSAIQKNEEYNLNDNLYMIEPFSVGYINNFISMPNGFYEKILNELKSIKLSDKSNDLYKFQQSKDFKLLKKSKTLQHIRSFFLQSILPWMKEATGIDLYDNEIDITYSVYKDSDYLLCHDDHLEARRIAFVWYLVNDDWNEENGGHLDIISTDESGEPSRVHNSFLPKQNSFVFFKVADNSYHQVREVKLNTESTEKARISINGWFRGPSIKFKDVASIPPPERLSPVHIEEALIHEWISEIYLSDQVVDEIRESFLENSEVQLVDFFNEDKYNELLKCLDSLEYRMHGPMNVMQTFLAVNDKSEFPAIVQEVCRILGSEAIMVLLSDMTGLNFHGSSQKNKEADESEVERTDSKGEGPSSSKKRKTELSSEVIQVGKLSSIELRHWKPGCYSLLRDGDQRYREARLDLFYSVGFPEKTDSKLDCGGFYSYFAEGEDEELLTIAPCRNALSLVYADDQTMGFMKYITSKFHHSDNLYDFHSTFYEYE